MFVGPRALNRVLPRHMRGDLPRASFIASTDTPIALKDANTQAVFADYIDNYDIKQAVDDHATVNIQDPSPQPTPPSGGKGDERPQPSPE